ncbi:MAG: FAD-binding oxidoreductase [Arsenophonus sp.]|nr:MAG: FAD-binding oxidoreductase [Arsenophonus sp.]
MMNWIVGKIVKVYNFTENLFSLIIRAPIKPFKAGQFTKLALRINDRYIQRAYSYVNAPDDPELEFYIVSIPDGLFTSELKKLKLHDSILIKEYALGFFTIDEIPNCKDLWMLSTGTAIGPFLSILQFKKNLEKFDKIILVHAVRYKHDLSYWFLMKKLRKEYKGKLIIQSVISRENKDNSLHGRIPQLIENRKLEECVGFKLNKKTSHIMLCGNPGMVKDTLNILKNKYDMDKHLRRKPGNITVERYW